MFVLDKEENMDKFMKLPIILATFSFCYPKFFPSFIMIMNRLRIFSTLQLLTRQFHFQ